MFVSKFEAADADKNLFINADEFKTSLSDIASLTTILADDAQVANLINDVSGRIDKDAGTINFFEWMFVR